MEKEVTRPVKATIAGIESEGRFHGWTNRSIENKEGKTYIVKYALIEDVNTGNVHTIKPEFIRFLDIG